MTPAPMLSQPIQSRSRSEFGIIAPIGLRLTFANAAAAALGSILVEK
jgi:hypothetical protein